MPETEVELLRLISRPLMAEIHFEVRVPSLSTHPFFLNYQRVCPLAIHRVCDGAMSQLALASGDLIFVRGETPTRPKMLFFLRGKLMYTRPSKTDVKILGSGDWACEATLWLRWAHRGDMRALGTSAMLTLDAAIFMTITREFCTPVFYPALYARELMAELTLGCLRGPGGYMISESSVSEDSCELMEEDSVDDVGWGDLDINAVLARVFPNRVLHRPKKRRRASKANSDEMSDLNSKDRVFWSSQSLSTTMMRTGSIQHAGTDGSQVYLPPP